MTFICANRLGTSKAAAELRLLLQGHACQPAQSNCTLKAGLGLVNTAMPLYDRQENALT